MPSDLLADFETFCQRLRVPTKDAGLKPLWPLYETQDYLLAEIRAALEADIHTLVILKGRQLGATTLIDTLTLYWLQTYSGMIGMLVSDDPDNMKYRRLVLRGMLATLPRASRYPVNVDNLGQLVWMEPRTREPWSMLLFAAAGKREDSNMNLGRYLSGESLLSAIASAQKTFRRTHRATASGVQGKVQGDNE